MKLTSLFLFVTFCFSFANAESGSFSVLSSKKVKAKHRQHYHDFSVSPDKLNSEFRLTVQNGRKMRLKDCSGKKKWRKKWCEKWNDWKLRWQKHTRVEEGQILINGIEVVEAGSLNKETESLEVTIGLAELNQLEVNLRGNKHSFIKIKIDGFEITNHPPVSQFVTSNGSSEVIIGSLFEFDGSPSSDDGSIVEYQWDFGDGNTAISSTPVIGHTFLSEGSFTVSLVVVDDFGVASQPSTLNVLARLPALLLAGFTIIPDASGASPFTIVASSTSISPDADIVSYFWNSGDGNFGFSEDFEHTYILPGVYNLSLTVTDSLGQTATYSEFVSAF